MSEKGTGYLTEEQIPETEATPGYGGGSWTPAEPTTSYAITADTKFVITYTAEDRTITVNYVDDKDNVLQEAYGENTKYDALYDVSGQIPDAIDKGEDHYIQESVTGAVSGTVKDNVVVTVVYTLDNNKDDVPDKYQVEVTYDAVNGTVEFEGPEYVTLYDAEGKMSETGTGYLTEEQIPETEANPGYEGGTWTPAEPTTSYAITADTEFVITYTAEARTITVNYVDDKDNVLQEAYEAATEYNASYDVTGEIPAFIDKDGSHYIKESVTGAVSGTVKDNVVITVIYTLDNMVDPEKDPNPNDPGDGVPDKYQIIITYVAGANGRVEGTIEEIRTVKTFDVAEDGTISNVQDSPATPAAAVTATPDNGYKFVNWTDGSSSYADVEAIQALQLMEDTTFTANFTEEANISILYQAETGGKVSPTEESLAPATGTANGSDAAADTGYRFVNWTNEAGEEVSKDAHFVPQKVNGVNVPATYTAHFEKADFAYGVHYYFDGTEDTSRAVSANGEFEAQIPFEASAAAEFNNRNYTLERIEKLSNGIITANAASNVVNIYYELDEMGTPDPEDPDNRPTEPDGIPDKYQITFNYVSKDTNTGTVTGVTKEVHTVYEFTRNEDGTITVGDVKPAAPNADVTVTPANGYAFDYWTTNGTEKDFTKDMAQLKAETYTKDTTFTAYFAEDTKGATDPADPEDNVPDNPDGIPDKYQTIFQYVSGGHGTVNGTVYEVYTFVEDGVYTEASKMPVKPNADVTVSADSGYRFENWTFGDQSYENADAIKAAEFTADATFTANFERRTTGGGSGSGSGGGGGSTSGGGATSVIRTDGTGETVTINPDEVPLAALPEGGQSGAVSIPDEDVPLFGLPKTGDNSIPVGGLVGMMLVSILGAFGISKKRKGEEEA